MAENGDIANWARSADEPVKQVGGAMDLAIGAKRLWVVMEHTTKDGEPRLRQRCTYPLTAKAVVKRVYTNLAVLDVDAAWFRGARDGSRDDAGGAAGPHRGKAA